MSDAPENQGQAAPAPKQVELDETSAIACYANFCRVTGTPEELIIDFGLNTQPMVQSQEKIKVQQRIILNYYTAKRMLGALHMAVQRHEAAFGTLETDIQKRVIPSAQRQSAE
ncbi:DUF3467 domain-containing protein [Blastopirellula marina]|uniref:DUF3467 domain-containing protein n=1 Tax=Blastopirellula marina TaxID=124 RepID=A0A2S8F1Q1_9BACT|nr:MULTISPECIES: DUF3467 domain-containing protein [Pirellulaceae]PQO26027.1 DUF3467 domain-containing protein [Blastopirellula marina]RCS44385.1 DUF3467 domain-containing protein [Bremerella cremea]